MKRGLREINLPSFNKKRKDNRRAYCCLHLCNGSSEKTETDSS